MCLICVFFMGWLWVESFVMFPLCIVFVINHVYMCVAIADVFVCIQDGWVGYAVFPIKYAHLFKCRAFSCLGCDVCGISLGDALLALGQSYECPSVSEGTLKDQRSFCACSQPMRDIVTSSLIGWPLKQNTAETNWYQTRAVLVE